MTTLRTVRPAERRDVPTILAMIRALAEYEHLTGQVTAREEDLATHLFGPRRYAEALVGEIDGMVAGYALFFHSYSTFLAKPGLYLEDLFVHPAHRRQGLGQALVAAVAAVAVERGCGRLDWAVLDWNAPALAFYASVGATRAGDWASWRLEGAGLLALARRRG